MAKQRLNVSDIAEVLLQEIDTFKASAKEIKAISEDLKVTTVQIAPESMSEFRQLVERQERTEQEAERQRNVFLSEIKALNKKQTTRLPNWLTLAIILLFIAAMTFSIIVWMQLKG